MDVSGIGDGRGGTSFDRWKNRFPDGAFRRVRPGCSSCVAGWKNCLPGGSRPARAGNRKWASGGNYSFEDNVWHDGGAAICGVHGIAIGGGRRKYRGYDGVAAGLAEPRGHFTRTFVRVFKSCAAV